MLPELPSLVISDPVPLPRLPSSADPDVTTWCDRRGTLGALSHVLDEEHWLHVLGLASFKLDLAANAITAVPWQDGEGEAIVDELQSTVWPALLQLRGREALHASAIATVDGVVAFCGISETGKSTLAYALSKRGYCHWADDAVVLEVSQDSVRAHPLPFHVRLRSPAAVHFGYSEAQLRRGRVRREGQHTRTALPLRTLCLLERDTSLPAGEVLVVERLSTARAFTGLMEHAIYFSLRDEPRKRQMLQQYLNVITHVPIMRLRLRPGLELLPRVLDAIETGVLQKS